MEAIQTFSLTKRYRDVTAVDGLDLTVHEGELFALLGVNGAGKTTTVKMLTCLSRPSGGDALLGGESIVKNPAAVKAKIGVSPQETAVAPALTVRENLELMAGMYGLGRASRRRRAEAMLEQFSLGEVAARRAGRLSGGWQRRLSIAMALIGAPQILFLDEPTLGLDVIARSELWETIRALRTHATVVLTTHYMEEAEALADRVGILRGGRLLVCATPQEIMAQTGADRFEEAFLRVVRGEGGTEE